MLVVSVWLLVATGSEAASLSGIVTLDEKPVGGAIVYLESVENQQLAPKPDPIVIEQRDLTFSPNVIPVVQGTTIKFLNSDNVHHGIFSPSSGVGKFNFGTYGHGEQRLVKLDTLGEVVILCNVHLEMEARVLVVKDPYFAVTTAEGRYLVQDIPPGDYLLRVWRKHKEALAEPLELSLARDLALDLRLKP
jgi:plastocyanin